MAIDLYDPETERSRQRERNGRMLAGLDPTIGETLLSAVALEMRAEADMWEATTRRGRKGTAEQLRAAATWVAGMAESLKLHGAVGDDVVLAEAPAAGCPLCGRAVKGGLAMCVECALAQPTTEPVGEAPATAEVKEDATVIDPFVDPTPRATRLTWDEIAAPVPDDHAYRARSVSQLTTFADCGVKYRLTKIDKLGGGNTAWWNVGGSAFHAVCEHLEKAASGERVGGESKWADVVRDFAVREFWNAEFDAEIARCGGMREQDRATWRAAKRGSENESWWRVRGEQMVRDYITWRAEWARDYTHFYDQAGRLGIELEVTTPIAGVEVTGRLDQVWVHRRTGDIIIVDPKSGDSTPGDLQLATYATLLDRPARGAYYLARKGQLDGVPRDLATLRPGVEYQFATMDRAVRAGAFLPRPSSFCVSCEVKAHCPAIG